jgi:hypothetical protein
MKTLSTLSAASVLSLLVVPGSAALRVFVAIAAVAENGVAMVSATELAAMTCLTERSVFKAEAYLQENGFIERESQGPGPFANRIRIVEPEPATASFPTFHSQHSRCEAPNLDDDEAKSILDLVAACYRPLNEQEQHEADVFFKHNVTNRKHIPNVLRSIKHAGGVASNEPLNFFFSAVRTYYGKLHA